MVSKIKKVADVITRGKNHLPGTGTGGTFPKGNSTTGPKPTKAPQSGKDLKSKGKTALTSKHTGVKGVTLRKSC